MKLHASKVVTSTPKPKRVRKPKTAKAERIVKVQEPEQIEDATLESTPQVEAPSVAVKENVPMPEISTTLTPPPVEENTPPPIEPVVEKPKTKKRKSKNVNTVLDRGGKNDLDTLSKMILSLDEKITKIVQPQKTKVEKAKHLHQINNFKAGETADPQTGKKQITFVGDSYMDLYNQIFG